MSNGCLYIFLDEGGNLDFAASGTKYFTLTSVCTKRPFTVCHELGKYKFDLIEYSFYPRMLGHLIRHVTEQERAELDSMKELIVITDSIPIKKKRAAVEKAVKTVLKRMLPSGCRFRVLHHASMSNMGLQLADYCNWAIFRKWESGDIYDK